ncbi:MAG: adenylate/guanylate cyclase domain-containing protein [Saprospiraceae bacterium]
MRQLIIIIFLFAAYSIMGQETNGLTQAERAAALHEAGNVLMQEDYISVFNKVLALGKFRGSQRLLDSLGSGYDELQKNNSLQIQSITDFFSKNTNSDSLLRLTRFYPDSIFQADNRYSDRFKKLIPQLLNYRKRKKRDDFFKVKDLNYIRQGEHRDSNKFILDFDKYWPFEVFEFENELQEKEAALNNLPKKLKEEWLYSNYQNELRGIQQLIKIDSLNQTISFIRQKKDAMESASQLSQERFDKYKKIGISIFILFLLGSLYGLQKSKQMLKSMNQTVLEEKKRSEELLLNMLPAEVARELKNKASSRAHKYDGVSVLFSDFQGFSQIAKKLSPEELVMELDFCFTAFDRIIDKYRLQKIKTIGDAYMCVGGLYTKGNSHVKRMAMAALEIQQFLNNLKSKREANGKHFFEARIGIHTGSIVAGVVGTKKFAFDIWGDTVNVAQQMEFHSEPGKVNISGETYELIKDDFNCTYRSKAIIKNMKAFWAGRFPLSSWP